MEMFFFVVKRDLSYSKCTLMIFLAKRVIKVLTHQYLRLRFFFFINKKVQKTETKLQPHCKHNRTADPVGQESHIFNFTSAVAPCLALISLPQGVKEGQSPIHSLKRTNAIHKGRVEPLCGEPTHLLFKKKKNYVVQWLF